MLYKIVMSSNIGRYVGRISLCAFLIKISTFLKSSYILGSKMLFFSGSSIAIPLVGAFNDPLICSILFIIKLALLGSLHPHSLALIIPGFCAALYWSMDHWSVRLLLPVACFVAFIAHPVGSEAYTYALYWLLPITLYFIPHKNIFLTALASTFTAHAVGSTIWMYTVPMSASMWTGLIPLVAIERLCFATGMTVSYYVIHKVTRYAHENKFVVHIFRHTQHS